MRFDLVGRISLSVAPKFPTLVRMQTKKCLNCKCSWVTALNRCWIRKATMGQQGNDGKLGDIYTFDEVCRKLRISRRSLSNLIQGTNFYSRMRRSYRFSDADVLSIWESMRSTASPSRVRLPKRTAMHKGGSSTERLKLLLTGKPRPRSVEKVGAPPDLAKLFTGRPRKRPE